MLADQRLRAGRDRRDRWRTSSKRPTKSVHDVFGVDARPHDDAHLGELGAHRRELGAEGLLRVVELAGAFEEGSAFGAEGGELRRAVWHAPVASGIANGRQRDSRYVGETEEGSRDRVVVAVCALPTGRAPT